MRLCWFKILKLSAPLQSSHLPGNMVQGAVEAAIAAGYRHIDTAFCYKNEHEVGKAVQAKIQQGIIKREDMFIVSKVRCCEEQPSKQGLTFALFASFFSLGMNIKTVSCVSCFCRAAVVYLSRPRGHPCVSEQVPDCPPDGLPGPLPHTLPCWPPGWVSVQHSAAT